MFHFGRLFGINLRKEVLLITTIGIWHLTLCVLDPNFDAADFIDKRKSPWTLLHPHTVYNIKWAFCKSRFFAVDPFADDDDDAFTKSFEVWSLRLYLATYITLLYPIVFAELGWLLAPWLCMAGVRFAAPYLMYRLYLWLLLLKYWEWVEDRSEVQAAHGAGAVDSLKEAVHLREGRRRARGWRPHLLDLSDSDLLLAVSDRDPSEEDVASKQRPRASADADADDEDSDSEEERDRQPRVPLDPAQLKLTNCKESMGTTEDCVMRQFNNIIINMASLSKNAIIDMDSEGSHAPRARIKFFALPSSAYIPMPDLGLAPHLGPDCSIVEPHYPPPKYLSEYPRIFYKNQKSTLRLSEWNKHLYFPHSSLSQTPSEMFYDLGENGLGDLRREESEPGIANSQTKEVDARLDGSTSNEDVDEIIEYKNDKAVQDVHSEKNSIFPTDSVNDIGIQVSNLSETFLEKYEEYLKKTEKQ